MKTFDVTAVRVLPDSAALADAAARHVAEQSQAAVATRGRFYVALSGGSTPRELHARLASPPLRDQIDWSSWHVFFGDERCVSPDDAQSNYRMARETLLDRVPVPASQVHRMRGELPPREAAEEYARELQEAFAP